MGIVLYGQLRSKAYKVSSHFLFQNVVSNLLLIFILLIFDFTIWD